MENEFHASVDDYLEWCKEDGVEPEKPYSGKFNIRISPLLHGKIAIAAKTCPVSKSFFIGIGYSIFVRRVLYFTNIYYFVITVYEHVNLSARPFCSLMVVNKLLITTQQQIFPNPQSANQHQLPRLLPLAWPPAP